MKTRLVRWLLTLSCFSVAACAVITVNVYFPEKAAKEAYKSLDEMLLKVPGQETPGGAPGDQAVPPAGEQPPPAQSPAAPQPQSGLFHEIPKFSLVSPAYAAENEADALAIQLASEPAVLKAYDEMARRLPKLEALFASGAVGLTNQGLVSVRDKSKMGAGDDALVAAENQNRKTVVEAMARAIIKLNKESSSALNQVMPKAAATYADTKREAAKPGWWVQLQNGRWVQK